MEIKHAKQISDMHNQLIQMERNTKMQMQSMPPGNNNNNSGNNNNQWPKRNSSNDQRHPTPLESANIVDESIPFCRPCDSLHKESTCAFARRILEESKYQQTNNASQGESSESQCANIISSAFAINSFNEE